jgi:hypothetical protein
MNYSKITDNLFIGNAPASTDYDHLRNIGVQLVINMRSVRGPAPDFHPSPMPVMWMRAMGGLFSSLSTRSLLHGAQAAVDTMRRGGKIYVHCAFGRHRGVAMGTCILIAQGMEAWQAMELVKSARAVANPYAFFIRPRILRFADEWRTLSSNRATT